MEQSWLFVFGPQSVRCNCCLFKVLSSTRQHNLIFCRLVLRQLPFLCELVPSEIPRTHSVTDIMCQVRWVELCDIWMTMNMVLILKLLLPSVKRFKSVSQKARSIQKKSCKDISATHWPLNRDSVSQKNEEPLWNGAFYYYYCCYFISEDICQG